MLIGITGLASSGKSYAAEYICRWTTYNRRKFGTPLKNMLRSLLRDAGCPEADIERYIEGDLKEQCTPYLGHRSTRHAMQTLGTEWGRECIDPDFWVDTVMRSAPANTVFDDVRFMNEFMAIKNTGGVILNIVRPSVKRLDGHVSENTVFEDKAANYEIINDSDVASYQRKLQTFIMWLAEYEAGKS